jgi:hypothetical protein
MPQVLRFGPFAAAPGAEDRREWRAGMGAATVVLGGAFACWVVFSAPIQVADLSDSVVPAADAASLFDPSQFDPGPAANSPQEAATQVAAQDTTPLTSGDIVKVQQKLKSLGFDPGAADGAAGPRTLSALNAYRKSLGLAPVTEIDRQAAAPLLP